MIFQGCAHLIFASEQDEHQYIRSRDNRFFPFLADAYYSHQVLPRLRQQMESRFPGVKCSSLCVGLDFSVFPVEDILMPFSTFTWSGDRAQPILSDLGTSEAVQQTLAEEGKWILVRLLFRIGGLRRETIYARRIRAV